MENNPPAFHPLDYVSVLQRRMWWLITPIVVAALTGAALVMFLPRSYETGATVGVAIPVMSTELLTSTQRVSTEERLRSIRQVLLSTPVLERVVREEGFDRHMPVDDAIGMVRSRVRPEYPRADPNLPPGTIEQFSIVYADSKPDIAQRIANRLADVFVEESSVKRANRAEETSAFIGMQVGSSQTRLTELETRLRAAKEAFMGALPEQTGANVAMVTGLQQQLETTGNAIRGEQDRLSVIEGQIATSRAGVSVATQASAPGMPLVASSAAARVLLLERQLAEKRGVFTDKHPEIGMLQRELDAARAEAVADAARPIEDRVATLRFDPNYNMLLKDQEQARFRIRDLQRQEAQIKAQIGTYRARVESAPRVEQQIATLQREYELEKEQYGALTARLRTAEMSENMVRNRGGEEFTVIARAPFPSEPATPNPQRLLLITLMLGICLGGGLALGREYLDRSIHDARGLNDIDLPVLGEIPRIANA